MICLCFIVVTRPLTSWPVAQVQCRQIAQRTGTQLNKPPTSVPSGAMLSPHLTTHFFCQDHGVVKKEWRKLDEIRTLRPWQWQRAELHQIMSLNDWMWIMMNYVSCIVFINRYHINHFVLKFSLLACTTALQSWGSAAALRPPKPAVRTPDAPQKATCDSTALILMLLDKRHACFSLRRISCGQCSFSSWTVENSMHSVWCIVAFSPIALILQQHTTAY